MYYEKIFLENKAKKCGVVEIHNLQKALEADLKETWLYNIVFINIHNSAINIEDVLVDDGNVVFDY